MSYGRKPNSFDEVEIEILKERINKRKQEMIIGYAKKYIRKCVEEYYEGQQIKDIFSEYMKVIKGELEEYSEISLGGIEKKVIEDHMSSIKDQIVDAMYNGLVNVLQNELNEEEFGEFMKSIGDKYFSEKMNEPPSEEFERHIKTMNEIRKRKHNC